MWIYQKVRAQCMFCRSHGPSHPDLLSRQVYLLSLALFGSINSVLFCAECSFTCSTWSTDAVTFSPPWTTVWCFLFSPQLSCSKWLICICISKSKILPNRGSCIPTGANHLFQLGACQFPPDAYIMTDLWWCMLCSFIHNINRPNLCQFKRKNYVFNATENQPLWFF